MFCGFDVPLDKPVHPPLYCAQLALPAPKLADIELGAVEFNCTPMYGACVASCH